MKLSRIKLTGVLGLLLAGTIGPALSADPGVTDTTIKIGMFAPLTGPNSLYGHPITNGALAVYNRVNDEGGIHGRKIVVVNEDDGCDPSKARAAVKKLLFRENIFLANGGACSTSTFVVRDEFINAKVPFVVMAANADKIAVPVSQYVFTTTTTAEFNGAVMLNFAKSMPGVKKIAVVKHANEWADANFEPVMKGFKAAGLELVAQEQLDSRAADATTQVLNIKAAAPDLTLMVLFPTEAAVFLRDAKKYGLKGQFLGSTATLDLIDLSTRAGGLAGLDRVYTVSYLAEPLGSAGMRPYADLYQKYFATDRLISLNFAGMSSALAVVEGLKRAGRELTRDKFIAAMETIKDADAGPAPCKLRFTAQEHRGCDLSTVWTLVGDEVRNVGATWRSMD